MPTRKESSRAPTAPAVYDVFPDDLGWALAVIEVDGGGRLVRLSHVDTEAEARRLRQTGHRDAVHDPGADPLPALRAQLAQYLAGRRRAFDLPLAPAGTPFQLRVWEALRTIPFGETRSYGEVAASVGSPGGSRAVGQANGHNPIGVVVPCHRVIAADGTLGGYTGGLERKRRLLALEGIRWTD